MDAFTPDPAAPGSETARADAIRAALIATVASGRAARPRRGMWTAALVLAGALVGAGGAAGAFAASGALAPLRPGGEATPAFPDAVAAPPGVTPGAPLTSDLGTPFTVPLEDTTEVPLTVPAGATHLRVTITPTSGGRLSFGMDAGGNNPGLTTTAAEAAAGSSVAWYEFPVDGTETALYLDGDLAGFATLQWEVQVPTLLGVNARGETYGVMGAITGEPDLVAVSATAPDGSSVEGYARAADLNAFSPDHPGQPGNPDEALAWQAERDAAYPNGWDVPVFTSDGVTRIGVFHIGG
ncbi:hypothetical protein [Microbacterium sp.]|uniref:hypothetical protein n=1 Tax=Microbacterium sp. TaxID=51671 RepID=UPI0039E25D2E